MRVPFSLLLPAVLSVAVLSSACSDDDDNVSSQSVTMQLGQTTATISRGGTVTVPVTLTRNNFGGTVNLTAENLPTGVTATFTPSSVTGGNNTSTLTLAASNTATTGTSNVTLRAAGTGITASTLTLPLTINATAGVTLGAGATAATALIGNSTSIPIFITRTGDFAGEVTLAATGLPTGVTAAFSPATITGTSRVSTLTLTAAGTATANATAVPVTITATGTGVTAQTQTVNLTIGANSTAGFTGTAAPAALVLAAGATGTTTVTISRQSAFTGNVQWTLEGAPAGVTATFTPNPATGTTTAVSIVTTAATVPGTYQLSLKGVSTGATDRTIPITLIVTAAGTT